MNIATQKLNELRANATMIRLDATRELESQGHSYVSAFDLAGKRPEVIAANAAVDKEKKAQQAASDRERARLDAQQAATAIRLKETAALQATGLDYTQAFQLAGKLPNVVAAMNAAAA